MRARVGALGEDLFQGLTRTMRGAGDVCKIRRIEGALDRPEDRPAPWFTEREFAHELVEDLEVLDELPDGRLHDHEVRAVDRELRWPRTVGAAPHGSDRSRANRV